MNGVRKIQAIPPVQSAASAGNQRHDAKQTPHSHQIPCAYPKCGTFFTPSREGQKYHRAQCRKKDWFENRFVVIGRTDGEMKPGDRVLLYGEVKALVNSEGLIRIIVKDGYLPACEASIHKKNVIRVEGM